MRLTALEVQGFRSLGQVKVNFDRLTMLIGGNDTGKSSILDLLDIVLGGKKKPDDDDFHCPPGGQACDTIEVVLEFHLDTDRDPAAREYALGDIFRIRKVYTLTGTETFYWGEHPADERLVQDFEKMLAGDQKELIKKFDPLALEQLTNKTQRAAWLREYAATVPQTQEWIPMPPRWAGFLPRFDRYSAMDYNAPENMILNTLRQVYEGVVYEEDEQDGILVRQPVKALRDIQTEVRARIYNKVNELLDYIKHYNGRIQTISFDPIFDFSGGLKAGGQFQIDDGRGLHYLSKTGDGTKRRMLMATLDWDRAVTLEQSAEASALPFIIRGYDEPDTNLDYEAQRTMYRAISSIVQAENTRIQAILCTHSPRMVDRAPAHSIRLLRLSDGCTSTEQLETDGDPDVEQFLRELARELGITNTLMFYERCFVLVEGETEENALPILYRKIYGNSLLEDGIHIINLKSNGAAKEFLKLLGRNRQELTIVFVDNDTQSNREARLTEETLRYAGFKDDFIAERLLYVGDQEFEDAFSDAAISRCLQTEWPKSEEEWMPDDIAPLREEKKFSKALQHLVWKNTTPDMPKWSKPIFGKELAQCCNDGEVPQAIQNLFEIARAVAVSD